MAALSTIALSPLSPLSSSVPRGFGLMRSSLRMCSFLWRPRHHRARRRYTALSWCGSTGDRWGDDGRGTAGPGPLQMRVLEIRSEILYIWSLSRSLSDLHFGPPIIQNIGFACVGLQLISHCFVYRQHPIEMFSVDCFGSTL